MYRASVPPPVRKGGDPESPRSASIRRISSGSPLATGYPSYRCSRNASSTATRIGSGGTRWFVFWLIQATSRRCSCAYRKASKGGADTE